MTSQRLSLMHRHHLGTQARDATREVALHQQFPPSVFSSVLAAQLIGSLTSPSMAAQRDEINKRLIEALDSMRPLDREILILRHFEFLTNFEAASALGLSVTAASNRYIRALERLREILGVTPEIREEK